MVTIIKRYKETETRGQLSGEGIKGVLEWKKKCELRELNESYGVKSTVLKRLKTVIEELKHRILAKSTKIRI